MTETIPVNKEILVWARQSMGLTIDDVAKKLDKEKDVIISWESGLSAPTYPQLEKLAYQLYKRPVAVFFFPSIPKESSPKTDFRTLPGTITDTLSPDIIKLYRKAKVYQINLKQLYEEKSPDSILTKYFTVDEDTEISLLCREIRNYLEIPIHDQFSWKSYDIAFKNWRNALETKGIYIFKDAFQNNNYSGFCVYDEEYPVIYINNSMAISRQIFTLFHELCHLLFHAGGIDFINSDVIANTDNKYKYYEVKCNEFAGEFLLPDDVFNHEHLSVDESNIEKLAKKYLVSKEVVLRKFLNKSIIDKNIYSNKVNEWYEESLIQKSKKPSTGHYYNTQKAYLGDNYISLVFSKYYQNKIQLDKVSDYLNVKVKNISTFEHFAFK